MSKQATTKTSKESNKSKQGKQQNRQVTTLPNTEARALENARANEQMYKQLSAGQGNIWNQTAII